MPAKKCKVFRNFIALAIYSGILYALKNLLIGKISKIGIQGMAYMFTGVLPPGVIYFFIRALTNKKNHG